MGDSKRGLPRPGRVRRCVCEESVISLGDRRTNPSHAQAPREGLGVQEAASFPSCFLLKSARNGARRGVSAPLPFYVGWCFFEPDFLSLSLRRDLPTPRAVGVTPGFKSHVPLDVTNFSASFKIPACRDFHMLHPESEQRRISSL